MTTPDPTPSPPPPPLPDADAPEQLEWEGRFLTARRKGRWEYVVRSGGMDSVVILALDGDCVVLVEQYRVPLDSWTIELPAGLVGDAGSSPDEDRVAAASRELREETGYVADDWAVIGRFSSSPGLTRESFTLLRATGLTRVDSGGGVEDENITVHVIPLADLDAFVAAKRAQGRMIDVRLAFVLGRAILEEVGR